MTFDEWLDIYQQRVLMVREPRSFDEWLDNQIGNYADFDSDKLMLLKLVRAQREWIHRWRTEDEGFHEGHMQQIADQIDRLEAALMEGK